MMEIKDGQILDLGGKTLQFFMTPMVHWPETMMTWLEADGILFRVMPLAASALSTAILSMRIRMCLPSLRKYTAIMPA